MKRQDPLKMRLLLLFLQNHLNDDQSLIDDGIVTHFVIIRLLHLQDDETYTLLIFFVR